MKSLAPLLLGSLVFGAFLLQFPAGAGAQTKEHAVYSFCSQTNCTDGALPGGLIEVNGTLFGTTRGGGNGGEYAYGTVFSLDLKTGTETVLHAFGGANGSSPSSDLIDVKGMLYGTTYEGGAHGYGTIYSLDLSTGKETVLYSFCSQTNCADGAYPAAGVIDVNGILYGTTTYGGTHSYYAGTVFSLDPGTGAEAVLYSFCSQTNCADGKTPYAGLTAVKGTLYSVTGGGGANGIGGTVFSIKPGTGKERTLYSFCSQTNCADGAAPDNSVIEVNGTLYGTTDAGGSYGYGTLFSLDLTAGTETALHSFGGLDGGNPYSSLIEVQGVLYGTTQYGGTIVHRQPGGTVFSFDLSTGTETVLYSFCRRGRCRDGKQPVAGLLSVKGRLYGTTYYGGEGLNRGGDGTVFWIKTP